MTAAVDVQPLYFTILQRKEPLNLAKLISSNISAALTMLSSKFRQQIHKVTCGRSTNITVSEKNSQYKPIHQKGHKIIASIDAEEFHSCSADIDPDDEFTLFVTDWSRDLFAVIFNPAEEIHCAEFLNNLKLKIVNC